MPMDFCLCGAMMLLMNPSAVLVLVCIGMVGCGCPVAMSAWRAGMASLQLMYRLPSSASAADDMTDLMICVTVRTAPLLGGSVEFSKRKKWPPARLRYLVYNR